MSAREAVLAAVRAAIGGERAPADAIAREARGLVGALAAVRPNVPDDGAIARFVEKATSERVTASVERLADATELPAAVGTYLARHGLPPRLPAALPPALAGLNWDALDLVNEIDRNEPAALTFAEAAIAETGTLVFPSSPTVPTLFNFLPLHHLAVVRSDDVVAYMEDVWQRFVGRPLPRSLNLVTGTSGTADIEGQNIRGAHGPRFLHIYLLDTG